MRSRYSGYAFGLEEYLLQTWHPETRPTEINLKKDHAIKWLGLQVQEVKSISESNATVDFIAHYKINGKSGHMHELSKFVCLVGRWYYRTGTDLNNTQDAFNLVRIDKAHNRFQ